MGASGLSAGAVTGRSCWLTTCEKFALLLVWALKTSRRLAYSSGDVVVRPALAIYGPHIPWDIAVIRDVDVFNGDRLRKYLKRRSRIREVPKLSREDIAEIYEAANAVLPYGIPAPNEAVLSGG